MTQGREGEARPLRLRHSSGPRPLSWHCPLGRGFAERALVKARYWGGQPGAGRAAPRAPTGETASEFSVAREVSTSKLLPLDALPLIWFWLETVIICPSCGTTTQPPAPLSGHIRLKTGFPFPSPPPALEEAEGPSPLEEPVAQRGGGGGRGPTGKGQPSGSVVGETGEGESLGLRPGPGRDLPLPPCLCSQPVPPFLCLQPPFPASTFRFPMELPPRKPSRPFPPLKGREVPLPL